MKKKIADQCVIDTALGTLWYSSLVRNGSQGCKIGKIPESAGIRISIVFFGGRKDTEWRAPTVTKLPLDVLY